ncbi:MAG: FtsX-like permease family protein [Thermoactinospora sp.]|nr:FtsX-like permease family protein [Thermoactinospora sp.]
MRTVLLASLRVHVRRYVAAAIAVVVGVAFVVVVGVLTSGARSGLMDGFGAPYRDADHVVSGLGAGEAIVLADRHGPNASPIGRAMLPMRAGDRLFPDTAVGPVAVAQEMRWQKLVSGSFPAREGEAVVDIWVAESREIAVGDRLLVGEGAAAADLRVVGLVESPSTSAQASVYVSWAQLVRWRDEPTLSLSRVAVRGQVGPLPAGARVQSPEEFVTEKQTELNNRVDALSAMLLLFAGIALVVSVLVIANTFSILFAQRSRDFALLRCVGATRRQVVGAVRREAVAVGVLASLVGVVVGTGAGYGLLALINTLAPTVTMGTASLPVPWLAGGFVTGVVVTVVAAWSPARRVVRVSPLAALRPEAEAGGHAASGPARLVLAVLLLVVGLALLGVAMAQDDTAFLVAGGATMFAGVLLFGPVLVPYLIRAAGGLLGTAGRLAAANAVRNPRRTATTTASLLVGVTVTSAALTGMATTRAALDEARDRRHPVDASLTSPRNRVTAGLLDRVRRTPGVEQALPVYGVTALVAGLDEPIPVVAAPDAGLVARDGGAFAQVGPGEIRIDYAAFRKDLGLRPGDQVAVRAGERVIVLRVVGGTGWGRVGVVSSETLAVLTGLSPRVPSRPGTPTGGTETQALWIRAQSAADPMRLVEALDDLADPAGVQVDNGLQARETEEQQLRVLTWSVLGLIAIAVVIALVGIANTLGLSVLERAREHALLRALGLTRGRLRRMLAAEALLLSAVAALLGTVIGIGFAWAGHETFVTRALAGATLRVPWPSLGAVVVIAALAGLLAAVLPARRAARVTPAAGLSLD